MKRFILIIVISIMTCLSVSAKTQDVKQKADTTFVNITDIDKFIVEETTSASGRTYTKFFCVYKGELISSNKTTADFYNLCKKHNVNNKFMLITKSNKSKRIIK